MHDEAFRQIKKELDRIGYKLYKIKCRAERLPTGAQIGVSAGLPRQGDSVHRAGLLPALRPGSQQV